MERQSEQELLAIVPVERESGGKQNLPGNRERTDTDSGNICERSGQNVQRRATKD